MVWTDIVSLIMGIASIATAVIVWRKFKPEVRILDADAATKYAELVDRAAKRESEYQNRIDSIQARMALLETRQGELEAQVEAANQRAEKFEGWAKRLTHQVQSLGGVPVAMEQVTVGK
jgi:hypothetical protein